MKKKIILFSIIGVVAVCIVTVIFTGLHANSPTKGAAIAPYDNPKTALLVIDVQNDITTNTGRYGDTTEFLGNVNQAITYAEETGMEILYVKNIYAENSIILLLAGGQFKDGTEGAELDDNLLTVNENIFTKSVGDSFSSREFEDYLISNSVDTLYIIGADASACVYSTARGGLNRGYNVNIIENAIITNSDGALQQMLKLYETNGIGVIDLEAFEKLQLIDGASVIGC